MTRSRSLFVSYRRGDGAGHAGLFEDRAVRRYGRRRVFRDVTSIDAGDDWRARLDVELARAAALVAVIGPDWTTILAERAGDGDDADDLVVHELVEANARADRPLVVPLLVGGAEPLVLGELPEELAFLAAIEGIAVGTKTPDAAYRVVFDATDRRLGWWARRLHRVAVALLAATLLAGVVAVLLRPGPRLETFEDRDTGLLVLPAVEARADGSRRATALGSDLMSAVVRSLDPVAKGVSSQGPVDRSFAIVDPDADAQRSTARSRLERSNADLLLAGSLERAANETRLAVDVYLGTILGAEDLVGMRLGLGDAVPGVDSDVAVTPGELDRLAAQVAAALSPAVGLLDGVAAYERRDLEAAVGSFDRVLASGVLTGSDAVLVHHLRANALAELGDVTAAAAGYREALALDPAFERSALGLAEAVLVAAGGSACSVAVLDADAVRDAEDRYVRLANEGLLATTRPKALVGLARAASCRASAFADRDDVRVAQANAAYSYLDDALHGAPVEPPNDLAEALAVGFWHRARLSWDLRGGLAPGRGLDTVVADLARVVELTKRPWLKADAYTLLAEVRALEADAGGATRARREVCNAHLRTLDLGPGTVIERRTTEAIAELRAAGTSCSIPT